MQLQGLPTATLMQEKVVQWQLRVYNAMHTHTKQTTLISERRQNLKSRIFVYMLKMALGEAGRGQIGVRRKNVRSEH